MQIKSRNIGKLVRLATLIIAFLTVSLNVSAYPYNRYNASNVINKTAYIIDEAYSVADYYGYWTGSNLSRAVYYNDYAQKQYSRRNYRRAVYYSLRAREYALMVIDGCDEYWDYYYYNNYGWSRTYGYNPYYTGSNHGHHYGNYNNYYNNNYNNYHNNHANNSNYNANRPDNYNDGRGSNGRTDAFDPNKTNNNGTQTGHFTNGSSTKNLNTSNYFDKDEIGLLKELPAETSMENDFKKENKDVKFDDKSVRNNTVLINQNRTKAQSFKKSTPETSRKNIQIVAPKRISEINNSNRNKEIKTNKTNNTETKVTNPEKNRNTNTNLNLIDAKKTNINKENKINNRNQNLENNRINTEKKNINTRNNNTKRTIEPTTPIKREVKTTESNTRNRTIKTTEKVKETKTLDTKETKRNRTR